MKNQRGFAAFEILILVLLIGVLGFVGYRAYEARTNKDVAEEVVQVSKDSYAGWKTHSVPYEKMSFKYPSEWKLALKPVTFQDQENKMYPQNNLTLTGPSGTQIKLSTQISGVGGGCSPGDCPIITFYKFDKVVDNTYFYQLSITTVEDEKSWYMGLFTLPEDGNATAYKAGYSYEGTWFGFFDSKSQDKFLNDFSISKEGGTEAFFSEPDIKTAEKILKSVKYSD